jgi:hypothetical protein
MEFPAGVDRTGRIRVWMISAELRFLGAGAPAFGDGFGSGFGASIAAGSGGSSPVIATNFDAGSQPMTWNAGSIVPTRISAPYSEVE